MIGAGAWGTALAQVAAAGGEPVVLWARDPALAASIEADRRNPVYLPGVALTPAIRATADPADLAGLDAWLVVAPAQHLRSVLARMPAAGAAALTPLVLCAKGIEAGTRLLMSDVAADARPGAPIAVLSGPTFAHEVAAGLPTAVTLAATDAALGEALAARLARPAFRPYRSSDVVGAEIGGAVKNVLAIACGVGDGAGLGQNARASLISRGFAEMTRFGLARGARAETLAGLAGLGDLVLTCSSLSSRNFALGRGLGRGERTAKLLADRRTVAEGAFTAPVLAEAAAAAGVEMPIVAAVAALLAGDITVGAAMTDLMARPLRDEVEG